MTDKDPMGESQQVQEDMDVDERTVSESQQVQDEAQHVKAELGLVEDGSKKLCLLEEADLGFAPPSLCSTASSASSSPHTTASSEESADSTSDFGSLLDEGRLDGIVNFENVRTILIHWNCCKIAPHTRGQRWCMACHSDICGCFRRATKTKRRSTSKIHDGEEMCGEQLRIFIADWKSSLAAYGRGSVRAPFNFKNYAMDSCV